VNRQGSTDSRKYMAAAINAGGKKEEHNS